MTETPTQVRAIRLTKGAVWFSVVAASGFAALALVTAALVPDWSNPVAAAAGSLVAIAGIVVGVMGAFVLWDSVRKRPAVVVDEEGITWGAPGSRNAMLRWRDIARIRTDSRIAGRFVDHRFMLDARPGVNLANGLSLGSRLRLLGRRLYYGTPWVITTFGSDISVETLDAILRRHFQGDWAAQK